MLSGIGRISPIPTEGDGSLVWAVVAFGVIVAFLALTWYVRLWGRSSATSDVEPDVPELVEKAA